MEFPDILGLGLGTGLGKLKGSGLNVLDTSSIAKDSIAELPESKGELAILSIGELALAYPEESRDISASFLTKDVFEIEVKESCDTLGVIKVG